MESERLILVPQLPIHLRYQEWWISELEKNLAPAFDEVVVLGKKTLEKIDDKKNFSLLETSINNELRQMKQYMKLKLKRTDVLLHCDLSFPGIFHNILIHRKPQRCIAFCHATALNRYDIFKSIRAQKWRFEKSSAGLYNKVLVATEYHKKKLNLSNVTVLGALPNPPKEILPPSINKKEFIFSSVSRPTKQKVDQALEQEIEKFTGKKINRFTFLTWKNYFQFLDRSEFLLVTSKEETYGLAPFDAYLRGCTPIMPKAFCFPELWPDQLLYNPKIPVKERAEQILGIAKKIIHRKIEPKNIEAINNFYPNLIKELKEWKNK